MSNTILKQKIKSARIPQWKIAAEMGVCEMTLIRWLRFDPTPEQSAKIEAAILKLSIKND